METAQPPRAPREETRLPRGRTAMPPDPAMRKREAAEGPSGMHRGTTGRRAPGSRA